MSPIRSSVVVVSLVAVALCSSCGAEDGTGFVISTERRIGALFTKVKVEDRLSVRITRGPQKVSITTDENLIDRYIADVDGETLVLRLRNNQDVEATFAHIEVNSEVLRELEVRDGSQVVAEATQAEDWRLIISGRSIVELSNVTATEFDLDITDKSQVTVTGQTGRVLIDAGDHSSADTSGLSATDAKLEASDGSLVRVRASRELEIDATGDSTIFVYGTPTSQDIDTDKGTRVTFVPDEEAQQ